MNPTPDNHATAQPLDYGLTLEAYAGAKRLPVDFLKRHAVEQHTWADGHPYLKMAYFGEDGSTEIGARLRHAIDEPCKWRKGDKVQIYGLPELGEVRRTGTLTICEGESDWQTLHFHELPVLALPGASTWKPEWDNYLEGLDPVYVVIEPDAGGEAMKRWVGRSRARDRIRLVFMTPQFKDPSALHIDDPEAFHERWAKLVEQAVPWVDMEHAKSAALVEGARLASADLARQDDILGCFVASLRSDGVVGEEQAGKLLCLCATSRLLPRPVSAVVKGPSSAGKSFLVDAVLRHFPPAAYYVLTAMSERALVYTEEEFEHRIIVIHEAAGLGEFAEYLVRSYQSEGHLRYETVETTAMGIKPRVIEKKGPIALILTTTAVGLHKENETRLFSIPVTDTPAQTKAIFHAQADEAERDPKRYVAWHGLQEVLAAGGNTVTLPFARHLAELTTPAGVRMRRDFQALLTLVRSHALLHQHNRKRDHLGRLIATLDDYTTVHGLVADLIGEGVEAAVPRTVRETVEAVDHLKGKGEHKITVTMVARQLGIDKSSASRRVAAAVRLDYLVNDANAGQPARIGKGEDLPEERLVLPSPEQLRSCMVAQQAAGEAPPPLPLDIDEVEETL